MCWLCTVTPNSCTESLYGSFPHLSPPSTLIFEYYALKQSPCDSPLFYALVAGSLSTAWGALGAVSDKTTSFQPHKTSLSSTLKNRFVLKLIHVIYQTIVLTTGNLEPAHWSRTEAMPCQEATWGGQLGTQWHMVPKWGPVSRYNRPTLASPICVWLFGKRFGARRATSSECAGHMQKRHFLVLSTHQRGSGRWATFLNEPDCQYNFASSIECSNPHRCISPARCKPFGHFWLELYTLVYNHSHIPEFLSHQISSESAYISCLCKDWCWKDRETRCDWFVWVVCFAFVLASAVVQVKSLHQWRWFVHV